MSGASRLRFGFGCLSSLVSLLIRIMNESEANFCCGLGRGALHVPCAGSWNVPQSVPPRPYGKNEWFMFEVLDRAG